MIHTYRGKHGPITDNNYGRARAVFKYCLSCSGWSPSEVKFCAIPDCPLYPFRNKFAVKKSLSGDQFKGETND